MNKVALITGGARGIGKQIAITLAKEGYDIALNYRSKTDELVTLKEEIENYNVKCLLVQGDVSNFEETERITKETIDEFGQIDVLVNNAGITKDMLFLMSPDKKPTLKMVLPNKVSILKFNSSQEEYDKLYSETGAVEVNLVGTCNLNDWNGVQYPQLMINDYEIVDKVKYIF